MPEEIPADLIASAVENAKVSERIVIPPSPRIAIVWDDRPGYGFRMYDEDQWDGEKKKGGFLPWTGPPRGGSRNEVFQPIAFVSANGRIEYAAKKE